MDLFWGAFVAELAGFPPRVVAEARRQAEDLRQRIAEDLNKAIGFSFLSYFEYLCITVLCWTHFSVRSWSPEAALVEPGLETFAF